MTIKNNTEISQVMNDALFQLQHLVIQNQATQPDFLGIIKTFLLLGSAVFDIQRPKNHASSGLLISQ